MPHAIHNGRVRIRLDPQLYRQLLERQIGVKLDKVRDELLPFVHDTFRRLREVHPDVTVNTVYTNVYNSFMMGLRSTEPRPPAETVNRLYQIISDGHETARNAVGTDHPVWD